MKGPVLLKPALFILRRNQIKNENISKGVDNIFLSSTRPEENKHPEYLSHRTFPITTFLQFCSLLLSFSSLPPSYLKQSNIQLIVLLEVRLLRTPILKQMIFV